jgi:hypothetical protein
MFNSLKTGLQTFRMVPGWSPIFEFERLGNLENVRHHRMMLMKKARQFYM